MLKRGLVLVVLFAMTSSVFAGATVDFRITEVPDSPCLQLGPCEFTDVSGPFLGSETVLVHLMVTTDANIIIRGAQIDWRASSPELILGQDIDTINQGIDTVPNFWFDYSPITQEIFGTVFPLGSYPADGSGPGGRTTGGYTDFSNLQQGDPLVDFVAAYVWAVTTPEPPPSMIEIQAGVPFRLGGMVVTLPSGRAPGDYTLDLLNLANTDDSAFGMTLDFGFGGDGDPVTKWASAAQGDGVDDIITYANGPLTLTVIPEPATLILLGLGGLAALRRRRK